MFYILVLGALWDVHGILTSMLDTIDNTSWEDKCKAGAYAALDSQYCMFRPRTNRPRKRRTVYFILLTSVQLSKLGWGVSGIPLGVVSSH